MLCSVVLVHRQGVPVPRWQLGLLPAHVGKLVVREEHQPDLGRTARIADLLSEPECTRMLRLYDELCSALKAPGSRWRATSERTWAKATRTMHKRGMSPQC